MPHDARDSPDEGLELERIAVGPYCVFDDFKLSPSPQSSHPLAPESLSSAPTMEDPLIATDYQFGSAMRGPWLNSAQEDMQSWTDWMQYDPAAAYPNPDHVDTRPIQGQPPFFNQLQSQLQSRSQSCSQSQSHPHSQVTQTTSTPTTTTSTYAHAQGVPFTFGETIGMPPAFAFNGNSLSSPLAGEVAPQNSFYAHPSWQPEPQEMTGNAAFPYSQTDVAPLPAPPSVPSVHNSPGSVSKERTNSSSSSNASPEPPARTKKRKNRSDDEEPEPKRAGKKDKSQPPSKTAHNEIEKRYRTNLNHKIAALRDSVPSLRVMSRPGGGTLEDDDPEDLEGLTPAHKLNKATVLAKATEYIRFLEKKSKDLEVERDAFRRRLDNLEKMTATGQMSIHSNQMGTPEGSRYQEDPYTPTHGMSMHAAQGLIPIPDNIAALQRGLPPQQHYAHAYPQYANVGRQTVGPPMVNGRRGSAMMGKLMVGSLAGLMVLEGIVEREVSQEQSGDHGLFALPINLAGVLAPRILFGASTAQLPLAKFLLILFACFYLIVPLLDFKPKPKRKGSPTLRVAATPSVASPVELRRKAWLTAIRTVWVPRHNFLLEVAALGLKTLKLSTRKIIGWPGYAFLTGLTKEQDAARIQAWEVALDAQLTGGDAEISRSRLLLTLMASGTLPDTPARLMLKALHIRVLLWDLDKTGHGPRWVLDEVSAKMARSYWNYARSEHRIALNMAQKEGCEANPLPEHLAALIERECDDVLVPAVIQRAYNLAWNKTSGQKTNMDTSMDGVVEDSAICSPLDALAAWYSSLVLRKGLANTLASKKGSLKDNVAPILDLAVQAAPPNSQAKVRALVAQAVVFDNDRNTRIASALDALPTATERNGRGFMPLLMDGYVATDVRQALTFAKCLSLLNEYPYEAHQRAVFAINNTFLPECTTTLLSFVAGYKILNRFMQDATLQAETSAGLERIASSLRMWVGHGTGKRSGLSNKVRSKIVEKCLDASRSLVGLAERKLEADIDDGYVSASVKDE